VKRVMFVDDELPVLESMRDALRPRRGEWDMTFVESGEQALAELEGSPRDIVVTDLRMPGMDGATLLTTIAERQPATIRIVLSGQAEIETLVRASLAAHRLVAKPCATNELMRIIDRACALNDIADRVELRRAANGAGDLPAAPRVYAELTRLLADPDAGIAEAAAIVEQDVGMSAKLLQLANSAFVGRRSATVGVRDAVAVLGLKAVRALALSTALFGELQVAGGGRFSVDELQRRSVIVARVARIIHGPGPGADDAFSAGLLLDIGLLVLARLEPRRLDDLITEAVATGRTLAEVEDAAGVVGHAEIGAHLLAVWGLPHSIVEIVAHHTAPTGVPAPVFDAVAATHIADAIVTALYPHPLFGDRRMEALDGDHLATLGVGDRLADWMRAAAELADVA
jgi:HD-like signal output (HDOD) protein